MSTDKLNAQKHQIAIDRIAISFGINGQTETIDQFITHIKCIKRKKKIKNYKIKENKSLNEHCDGQCAKYS